MRPALPCPVCRGRGLIQDNLEDSLFQRSRVFLKWNHYALSCVFAGLLRNANETSRYCKLLHVHCACACVSTCCTVSLYLKGIGGAAGRRDGEVLSTVRGRRCQVQNSATLALMSHIVLVLSRAMLCNSA